MTVPEQALDLIRHFEGLRLEPYRDGPGYPTIGWGHLLGRDKSIPIDSFEPITRERADELLAIDAQNAAKSVRRLIELPVNDNGLSESQYAALIDFVFNLGGWQLQVSTLRKVINRGELDDAPEQFARWCYAGATKLPGLVRRRQAEINLWRQ